MSDANEPVGEWKEYTNDEGRTYWANTITKQSRWDKPDELMTPFERAVASTNWKQYTSKGRTYYVNSVTKETQWDLPTDLAKIKKKLEDDEKRANGELDDGDEYSQRLLTGGASEDNSQSLIKRPQSRSPSPSPAPSDDLEEQENLALGPPPIIPPNGFSNTIEAENAFVWLLKKHKVDESWQWDRVMRTVVMDPIYKALGSMAEKKSAWQKYNNNLIANREQLRRERLEKFRPYIHRILKNNTGTGANKVIKTYTTFPTADVAFKNDKYWKDLEAEEERRQLFEEYMREIRMKEQAAEIELNKRNIDTMHALVKELPINVSTRWRAARDIILSSDQFKADAKLQSIEEVEIIKIFDVYAQQLLGMHTEQMQKTKLEKHRKARRARDDFRNLLSDLEAKGKINATTKWKDFLPTIADRPEYDAILGIPGSSPLELFQDVVDDVGEAISTSVQKIYAALDKAGRKVELGMKRNDFEDMLAELKIASLVDDKYVDDVHAAIQAQLEKAARDARKKAERRKRHLMDDLRYAMKKADPPINLEGPYEDAIASMEKFEEFAELDDQGRRDTFDKFVRRQKEKLRDREKDKDRADRSEEGTPRRGKDDRHRDRDRSDRDKDRDREGGRSRSPSRKERRDRDERRSSLKYEVESSGGGGGKSRRRELEEGEATDDQAEEDRHVAKKARVEVKDEEMPLV